MSISAPTANSSARAPIRRGSAGTGRPQPWYRSAETLGRDASLRWRRECPVVGPVRRPDASPELTPRRTVVSKTYRATLQVSVHDAPNPLDPIGATDWGQTRASDF